MCYSRPTVYVYVLNFVLTGLFCRPLAAKNSKFCRFWTSAFCDVANWRGTEKVERVCKTTNHPISHGAIIVSVF